MASTTNDRNRHPQEQQHPQEQRDRAIVDSLLGKEPSDRHLTELARLLIRYTNFPGARDIQQDLRQVLQQWNLTQEQLYAKTREIHALGQVYRQKHGQDGEQQDWS